MDGFGFSSRTQAEGAATVLNTASYHGRGHETTLKSTVLAIRGSPLKGHTVLPTRALVKTCHTVHSPIYKGAKMYIPFICRYFLMETWGSLVYVDSQSAPLCSLRNGSENH